MAHSNEDLQIAITLALPKEGGSFGTDLQTKTSKLLGEPVELVEVFEALHDLMDDGEVIARDSLPGSPINRKIFELRLT